MATFINSDELPAGSVIIVFDIEAIGEVHDPGSCFIWNLAAQVLGHDNLTFEQYIVPPVDIPEPAHPKLFKVTSDFLATVGAEPWPTVIDFFWKWVSNLYDPYAGGVCVLVSHGNFRFDKPVFEAEHRRWGTRPPPNVLFFDTLHWFRSVLRRESSYSLQSLYQQAFHAEIHNQHLAIYDVYALNKLIHATKKSPLTGTAYPFDATPMLRIPMVGQHTERLLIERGFSSIESLWACYDMQPDKSTFVQLLAGNHGMMLATAENVANYLDKWATCAWTPTASATGGHTEFPTPTVTDALVDRTWYNVVSSPNTESWNSTSQ